MKVLIVEEDQFLQNALRKLFTKQGFEVLIRAQGDDALRTIAEERIRIVVTDWVLPGPGMDGLALCRRVRKLRLPRYVYMIVITSKTRKKDIVEALDAGADDYITKPFEEEELAARVRAGIRIIELENKLINNQKKLMKLAKEDPLTRILNRRALFDEILREISRSSRENSPFATVLVDADDFKAINEAHGQLAGDLALVEFAKRIKDSCREYDLIGRYGGEEFLIFLPKTDREGSRVVAERIREAINAEKMIFGDASISLTASVGLCPYSFSGEGRGKIANEQLMDELIKKTDYALYLAKQQGKNRVIMFEPRMERELDR
ncbi:MAG: diguanylate cyclase [Spirochaetes bacterium]|nr:MAG: diguanylate cyclase [Spirochaetota bacterium]